MKIIRLKHIIGAVVVYLILVALTGAGDAGGH